MPADVFKEVLYHAGEGIAFEDENNAQRYLRSLIGDGLIAHTSPSFSLITAQMSITDLHAFGHSGAPFEDGIGTRIPNFKAGLIAQRIAAGAPNGNDSNVLLYYLGSDEPSVVRPAAAANPRWDVVSIQLAYADADTVSRDFKDAVTGIITAESLAKQRRVNAAITWTQGVENASPVEPSIPGGHVKLAAFRVSPGMTTFDPTTDIRDYRMPVGPVQTIEIPGLSWSYRPSEVSTEIDVGYVSLIGGADATALLSNASPGSRVVAVGYAHTAAAAPAALNLIRQTAAAGQSVLRDLSSIAVTNQYNEFDILSSHGAPLWANGYAAGFASRLSNLPPSLTSATRLGLRLTAGAATTNVYMARFFLVGP